MKRFNLTRSKLNRIFLLFVVIIMFTSTLHVYSLTEAEIEVQKQAQLEEAKKTDGSVLDPLILSAYEYMNSTIVITADEVVGAFATCFDPSFNAILDLSNGRTISPGEYEINYPKDMVASTPFVTTIFNFATLFGYCLATILLLANEAICLMGQAEVIRDSPIKILAKYVISVIGIYFAFDIIWKVLQLVGKFWTDFVVTGNNSQKISYTDFTGFCNISISGNETSINGFGKTISNVSGVLGCLLWLCCIALTWKLVKQFLRLFLEIVERYFVMMILLLLFPAVLPAFISNNSKNILHSYIRMFICQVFIVLINMVFMKIFITVLIAGGWSAGLLNYIAALAYMKVCQRIDTYMLSMGLNVAQTGGGLMDAIGGSFQGVGRMLKDLGKVNQARKNLGDAISSHGVNTNNHGVYKLGEVLGASIGKTVKSGGISKIGNDESFTNKVLEARGRNSGSGSNTVMSASEVIPTLPATLLSDLQSQGLNMNNVHHVEQLDDKGSKFAYFDRQGNQIAASNGSTGYYNPDINQEISNKQAIMDIYGRSANEEEAKSIITASGLSENTMSNPYLDNESIKNITGASSIEPTNSASTTDNEGTPYSNMTPGTQNMLLTFKEVNKSSGQLESRVELWQMKNVANNKDTLMGGYDVYKTVNSHGQKQSIALKCIDKNPKQKNYNPGNAPENNKSKDNRGKMRKFWKKR